MNLKQTVCSFFLLLRIAVRSDSKVFNPVRVGEFKFLGIVRLRDKFKCLAVLVSNTHVLTPCDCIGFFVDEYLYKYYFPDHLKVIAGAVREKDSSEDEDDAQTRTPYFMRKHPQCMPYVKGTDPISINWTMYNYGLMTVSFPFNSDYRVAPISITSTKNLKTLITDLIKTQGECKTVSFPIHPTNSSWISTHMEWSHVQLKPTAECEKELCSPNGYLGSHFQGTTVISNSSFCDYDEYYFFGKFCATERFLKARDACFNNSGAPVICGGTYIGHLGDTILCPKAQEGRFFMYSRFDWALPFITQSSAMILKSSVLTLFVLLAQMKL